MDESAGLGVVFDFDGTLVRLAVDWEALRADLARLLVPFGFRSGFRPLLEGLCQAEEYLKGEVGEERASQVMGEAWERLRQVELEGAWRAREIPGARGALSWLRERGIPFGVASNTHSDAVSCSFARLGLPAPLAIVGRERVRHPKPHPEGTRRALELMGVQPEHAWMVGDGPHDIQAGMALGMHTVLLRTGGASLDSDFGATQAIARPDGLIGLLEGAQVLAGGK